MLHTTFTLWRKHSACADHYQHLADALGGVDAYGADTPIPLSVVLTHGLHGLDDALGALRAVPEEQAAKRDRLARLFACWCAEQVLHIFENQYPDDKRPRNAIETARCFALGKASIAELYAAHLASWNAYWDIDHNRTYIARPAREAVSAATSAADKIAYNAARGASSNAAGTAAGNDGEIEARKQAGVKLHRYEMRAVQAVKLWEMLLTESAGRKRNCGQPGCRLSQT